MRAKIIKSLDKDAALQLGLAIHRLRVRNRAESPNSSGSGFSHLSILIRILEQGSGTANELAKSEHLRPQSVAETIAALKARGLVRTEIDPSDERRVLLSITKAGREAIEGVTATRAVWLQRAVGVVGPNEVQDLKRTIALLNRLADH